MLNGMPYELREIIYWCWNIAIGGGIACFGGYGLSRFIPWLLGKLHLI